MSELKWAFSKEANVKEPIEALKENGWQYGDIPTASNFNWLFKEVFKELTLLKPKLEKAEGEIKNLEKLAQELKKNVATLIAQSDYHKDKGDRLEDRIIQICQYLYQDRIDQGNKIKPGLPYAHNPDYKPNNVLEE